MAKVVAFLMMISSVMRMINAECSTVYENGVDKNNQNIITNKHNELRLLLARGQVNGQPRATNMLRMSYDAKLAQAAQNIANTCDFKHVPVHDSRWSWVGQNLYMSMSTSCVKGADWNGAIQSWFNEHKDYVYPSSSDARTGHYTQVAWATSNNIGCGYTFFRSNTGYPCQKLYVCNYGPGGNYVGQAPYKTGGGNGCVNLC